MPEKTLFDEFYIFLTKIIFPAFLAIGFKLAIEMKRTKAKISVVNFCLSMVIGVVGAYLSSPLITSNFSEDKVPMLIGLTAIISEKVGEFLIYQFNVELFLTAIADGLYSWLTKIFKTK